MAYRTQVFSLPSTNGPEATLKGVIDTVPFGYFMLDPMGRLQAMSGEFLKLLGISFEEARETNGFDRLHPNDLPRLKARWEHCLATGEAWDEEVRFLGADGQYHFMITRGQPLRDEHGQIRGWCGLNLDIDERKASQERALGQRDDLLLTVSHDLKTPLTAIRLFSDLILLRLSRGETEQAVDSARKIQRSIDSMAKFIGDLLDVARIEAGKLSIKPFPQQLGPILQESLATVQPLADAKAIRVFVGADEGLVASCDRDRIAQVAVNIVGNAIKFTPESGSIRIDARAVAGAVQVSVTDTGPGVGPDQLPYVFDRFWRAQKSVAQKKGQGTGLGLSIAKGIIEAHGGRIWVENIPGSGACFTFSLPAAVVQ